MIRLIIILLCDNFPLKLKAYELYELAFYVIKIVSCLYTAWIYTKLYLTLMHMKWQFNLIL